MSTPLVRVSIHPPYYICRTRENAFSDLPRKAGFDWSPEKKVWYTASTAVAVRLFNYFDTKAKNFTVCRMVQKKEVPPDRGGPLMPPGLTLFDFQKETAVPFVLERNHSYLALEPGLGKTIVAACSINHHWKSTVVFCPPFLAHNWKNELEKWNATALPVVMYDPKKDLPGAAILVVPDSRLSRRDDARRVFNWAQTYAANLVVDEAHRYKADQAKRTQNLLRMLQAFHHKIFMSGTPILNRPIELFPLVNAVAANCIDFMSRHRYGLRYCEAFYNGHGWDYSGASNIEELGRRLMPHFMLRLTKAEVLDELPPKIENFHVLPSNAAARRAEVLLVNAFGGEIDPAELLEMVQDGEADDLPIATYRRAVGLIKAKEAVDYIQGCVDVLEENVLVFAHHTDVIKYLSQELADYGPAVITGATPMAARQSIVDGYQNDPSRPIFIGNISAAGVGLTLTKATRVIFVEFDWTHANNEQAADRAHRIGQRDSVNVDYLIFKDTLDESILRTARRKARITKEFFQ